MQQLDNEGFEIVNDFFTEDEVLKLTELIESSNSDSKTFRRSKDLFAIRQFFKELPEAFNLVFTEKFKEYLNYNFGRNYFVVKSIYFDKPATSNWFVSYHQDLTISVDKRIKLPGYGPWTVKQNQFAVQPPVEILEDNFTARIHLDDTDSGNGALRIIPRSHLRGVYPLDTNKSNLENEFTCSVSRGGVMFMKPLLFHSSSRTLNNSRRRVIHIEFSRSELPLGLNWSEKESY